MKRIQDKITELSKKPSTNADTIAVLRMCQVRIEQLEQENSEKAAQVEQLRKTIINATNAGVVTDTGRWIYSIDTSVLDSTPAQCLAEVKAQAIDEAFSLIIGNFDFGQYGAKLGLLDELAARFTRHANQLRQQAKDNV